MKETMQKADLKWGELPFDYVRTDCHVEYSYRDGKWDAGRSRRGRQNQVEHRRDVPPLRGGMFRRHEGVRIQGRPCYSRSVRKRTGTAWHDGKKAAHGGASGQKHSSRRSTGSSGLNRRFVPPYGSGASLYVRPLLIGTTGTVGIKPSREFKLVVFVTPVGPYFRSGLKPVKLWVERDVDRASPGGVGDAKTGGNYAAGLRATWGARENGYAEVLFLDAREKKYVNESGSSNFYGITKDGKYVTPKSPSILASITNKSLMELAKDLGIPVEQRVVPVTELPSFVEAGLVGTATIITPVYAIQDGDRLIEYGPPTQVGPVSQETP